MCVCIGTNKKKTTALSQRLILCEKLSCNIPLPQAWQVSSSPPNAALAPLTYSINPVILTHSTAMLGAEQSAGTACSRSRYTLHLQQSPSHHRLARVFGLISGRQPPRECAGTCVGLALQGEVYFKLSSLQGSSVSHLLPAIQKPHIPFGAGASWVAVHTLCPGRGLASSLHTGTVVRECRHAPGNALLQTSVLV